MMDRNERLVSDEINRLAHVLGKDKASRIRRAYLLGDETVRERIFELIDVVKAAVAARHGEDSVLMEPPSRETASAGDIIIGDVVYGTKSIYPVSLSRSDMLTHVGIFGSSGYGKTNISYSLIKQLSDNEIPVIVFDFSKRNYRDLLSTDLKARTDIYTVGKNVSPLKFNPLLPPEGIPLSQWMKEFASIFDHAYWLLGGGRHIILKAMDAVFRSNTNPKLSDLKEWIDKYGAASLPARERNWLATASRPLESLCFKELGEVFDCQEGIRLSDFLKPGRITILELDPLDNSDRTFFIEIVLQWLRDWLLTNGNRETLNGVIILEEAHHVLNREKSRKLGSETVMDLIFREIRELGLGVVYIDQHPSLVSYPALGNTSNHIYMNLGLDTQHSSDVQDASSMLGLDYKEQGSYLRQLPVGQGFMLRRNSDFRSPFAVRFREFQLSKGSVTDEDVSILMKRRSPFVQAQPTPQNPNPSQQPQDKDLKEIAEVLQSHEWELIRILGEGQATFASQIYRQMRMSGGMFKKRVQGLLACRVVGMKSAKIRKNRMNYYYLTELGERIFHLAFKATPKRTEPMDIKGVLEALTLAGWRCSKTDNTIAISQKDKQLTISLESSTDPKELMKSSGNFFLCSSEKVKNLLIQKAARTSAELRRPMTIFISTLQEFDESGELEQISFD